MKTVEKAKQFFDKNKHVEELHATSDGFLFTSKEYAKQHAKTLKNKKLRAYKNKVQTATATAEPVTANEESKSTEK